MADDRPANDDLAAVVAELLRKVDDLETTALVRADRRPTGTTEFTPLTVAPPDTLFVQGQTLPRASYEPLAAWIDKFSPAGFSTTATTITLPDWRNRAVVGATTARPPGTLFGSATATLAVANLPPHNHAGETGVDRPSHRHSGRTGVDTPGHAHYTGGNHGGHRPNQAPGVGGQGAAWPTTAETFSGDAGWSGGANAAHGHDFTTGNATNAHTHDFTTSNTGSGTPFAIESPAVALNYIVWT